MASRSPWAALARLGQAHWFFGNLYEAAVDVPRLVADAEREPRLLGPGSPLRYYAPAAPVTVAATGAALVEAWRSGGDRRAVATSAAGTLVAAGLTGYLVRAVNLRLLRGGTPPGADERRRLLRTWHRLNLVRLAALAVAALALRRSRGVRAPATPGR
ncbi:anthrone oxygenase family protein [Saccharothrix sp. HUAS TT1]|uniref:anthrone oxygenase family protein n=1 Tax=unclassified Saccharothrix TaxID=2593673 RepID=UPI00345BBA67